MHVAVAPIVLGAGEPLFDGPTDLVCVELVASPAVAHVRLARA